MNIPAGPTDLTTSTTDADKGNDFSCQWFSCTFSINIWRNI